MATCSSCNGKKHGLFGPTCLTCNGTGETKERVTVYHKKVTGSMRGRVSDVFRKDGGTVGPVLTFHVTGDDGWEYNVYAPSKFPNPLPQEPGKDVDLTQAPWNDCCIACYNPDTYVGMIIPS